jgi:hypothetical protein
MAISIYRWTDGPYLAFNDQDGKRYVLYRSHAAELLQRLSAHICQATDRGLVIDRRFVRDRVRDLTVIELYYQDCDNCFEVITATGPMLLLSPVETGTMLRLAVGDPGSDEARSLQETPRFIEDATISALANSSGVLGAPYG